MLSTENKTNIEDFINWIEKWYLSPDRTGLENLDRQYFDERKIRKINYHFRRRRLQKDIQKYENVIDILENLKNFMPSRLYIDHQIKKTINSILPLLDSKDKDAIESVFYEAQNAVRLKDENELKQIKINSGKVEDCGYGGHYENFLKALREQEKTFREHNYLVNFSFANSTIDDSKFISLTGTGEYNLSIIDKLMRSGRLENKYIKNNIEKIKNAYISIGKMTFINSEIDELITLTYTTSDIDFEKLKSILMNIKNKNERIIDKSSKVLAHFNEEELREEYNKYMQEQSDKNRRKQNLDSYKQLMYELIKAKRSGKEELTATLKTKIAELKLDISPYEKSFLDHEIEQRVDREEQHMLYTIQERDRNLAKIAEKKRELEALRSEAIARLINDGRINTTEETVALENGEFKTVIKDEDARERMIAEEISRIQSEEASGKRR